MHRFKKSPDRWWQKPLVIHNGRSLPAELAVLDIEKGAREEGVWLNSRGTKTGVIDLVHSHENGNSTYRTKRVGLPDFVTVLLEKIYADSRLKKGCPDLVFWMPDTEAVRFVEVKCPHWDAPTPEQDEFMTFCKVLNSSATIVEWEFQS